MTEPAYTLNDPAADIAIEQFLAEYRKARGRRDGEETAHVEMIAWLDGAQAATGLMETIAAGDPRTANAVDRFWRRVSLMMFAQGRGVSEAVVEAEIGHWRCLPEAEQRRQNLETLRRYAADTQDPEAFPLIERLEAELRDLEKNQGESS